MKKKILFVFLCLVFIKLYAYISVDYSGYVTYFKCAQNNYCSGFMNGVELSFVYGSKIFGWFFGENSAEIFLFLIAATSFLIKTKLINDSGNFWLPVFCYLAFQFFYHEMTQLRAGLGIAFLWVVICKKKETGKFSLFFSALSILMHYSMVIGLFVYYLLSFAKNKLRSRDKFFLTIFIYTIASLVGYFNEVFINFLPNFSAFDRLAVYVSALGSGYYSVPQFSVQLLATLLLSLVAFYLPRTVFLDNLHNMIIIGVSIYLAFYWIPVIPLRVFEILTSVMPIYFAFAFNDYKKLKVKIILFVLCIVVGLNFHLRNNSFSEDRLKVDSELEELI